MRVRGNVLRMLPKPADVVSHIRRCPETSTRDLAKFWKIEQDGFQEFARALFDLQRQGVLVRVPVLGWCLTESVPYRVGTLQVNNRGQGFVRVRHSDDEKEDIFVRSQHLGSGSAGDVVMVKISKPPRRARGRASDFGDRLRQGRVVDVVERSRRLIKGRFIKTRLGGVVHPLDGHHLDEIGIPQAEIADAKNGDCVMVRLLPAGGGDTTARGQVALRVVDEGSYQSDLDLLCVQYEFPAFFSKVVEAEARKAPAMKNGQRWPDREDLREYRIFTIDPIGAKDFDDAVSLEEAEDGHVKLGVHIADVSHFVQPNSALHDEARRRGTSVYLSGRVIPMLPERLSNELCSLRPGEDRLTKTVWMTFDAHGELLSTDVSRSVIRSQRRFTYEEVLSILEPDSVAKTGIEVPEDSQEWGGVLRRMADLRDLLAAKRYDRGALSLDIPKLSVRLNDRGDVTELLREERDGARSLIEEFMVAANEAVALFHVEKGFPLAARVHPSPDLERFAEFRNLLKALGLRFHGEPDARELQRLIEKLADDPLSSVVQLALLRTMGHAEYAAGRDLHFALATTYYCHFTSPIRRFPDLLMHQILDDYFDGSMKTGARKQLWKERLAECLPEASELERRAEEAEREMTKLRLIRYLQSRIGEEMTGRISFVHPFGFFVRVEETLIEGLVHVSSLRDDYYDYDREGCRLVARRKKQSYAVGDLVRVVLSDVDPDRREVSFRLVKKLRSRERR